MTSRMIGGCWPQVSSQKSSVFAPPRSECAICGAGTGQEAKWTTSQAVVAQGKEQIHLVILVVELEGVNLNSPGDWWNSSPPLSYTTCVGEVHTAPWRSTISFQLGLRPLLTIPYGSWRTSKTCRVHDSTKELSIPPYTTELLSKDLQLMRAIYLSNYNYKLPTVENSLPKFLSPVAPMPQGDMAAAAGCWQPILLWMHCRSGWCFQGDRMEGKVYPAYVLLNYTRLPDCHLDLPSMEILASLLRKSVDAVGLKSQNPEARILSKWLTKWPVTYFCIFCACMHPFTGPSPSCQVSSQNAHGFWPCHKKLLPNWGQFTSRFQKCPLC